MSLKRVLPGFSIAVCVSVCAVHAKPRARDLGVPFDGKTGRLNAITDVAGVEVGHVTLITGSGKLIVGTGPVRTGVTAIFPLAKAATQGVAAAYFTLNGCGEMTGTHIIEEFGTLFGPVVLTNTLSVGVAHDAIIEWSMRHFEGMALYARSCPVVAETWDGSLNDIYGRHVRKEHVLQALDSASGGRVEEGNVGGGTGMRALGFQAGVGTASRVFRTAEGEWTLGVLVQANYGRQHQLRIAGVPVGQKLRDSGVPRGDRGNSVIVVIATDAPLLPTQLRRIAKRAALGLARTGSIAMDGSGDIFIAFSNGNTFDNTQPGLAELRAVRDVNPLFEATVQATEEAVINALVAAEEMTGADGRTYVALPHEHLRDILRKYNRLQDK